MMIRSLISISLLCLAIGTGAAFAQTTVPAGQPDAAKASKTDKQSISKSCSDQANAKGLHDKEQKSFDLNARRAVESPRNHVSG